MHLQYYCIGGMLLRGTKYISKLQVVPYEQEVAGQRMRVVEDQLSKAHYILGEEFSAVDIVCGQVLTLAEVSSRVTPSLVTLYDKGSGRAMQHREPSLALASEAL